MTYPTGLILSLSILSMFSYRHAFHAGNHADVLKHATLIATIKYLVQKETPLMVLDTHAGSGLYRLDHGFAKTSGEAQQGLFKLVEFLQSTDLDLKHSLSEIPFKNDKNKDLNIHCSLLMDYLEQIAVKNGFSKENFFKSGVDTSIKHYCGSPFIAQQLLRQQDKLKLFELHPSDAPMLQNNVKQAINDAKINKIAICSIQSEQKDGFTGALSLLPPPNRRALVICDPSYELKEDYARCAQFIEQALKRFATGTYFVWYPRIANLLSHDLPKKLKSISNRSEKPWLHATLTVKGHEKTNNTTFSTKKQAGLNASGIFIVNPPFVLKDKLAEALPVMVSALGQDAQARFTLEASS